MCSRCRKYAALQIGLLAIVIWLSTSSAWAEEAGNCPAIVSSDKFAAQVLQEGNAAFERGDLSEAEERWKMVRGCARQTVDWPKSVYNLGQLERRRKDYARAIAYFAEVIASRPNDHEPGASLMETNRNYSYRSALGISQSYEDMGSYWKALQYSLLAKRKYRYYSWCGTCIDQERMWLDKRIAYLSMRASRAHLWGVALIGGVLFLRMRTRKSKARSTPEL